MRSFRNPFWPLALATSGLLAPAWAEVPFDPASKHPIPPFQVPAVKPDVACERFIAIGDMGTGRNDQKTVAAAMAKRAKSDGIDFVLTLGDNFYENGVQSVDDPQWKRKFEDVYSDSSLQVPFYASLGNHDHLGKPEAQVEYAKTSKRWIMPAFYYTFARPLKDGTRVQFFAIDSDAVVAKRDGLEKQLAWLDAELGKSSARWKIVYGHHPLHGHNPERGPNAWLIETLEPIFVRHHVDAYFAGHDHTLEMIKPVKGVHHVISGAAAGLDKAYPVEWTDESHYAATGGGFVLCRVSRDELVIEFVRTDGVTQYAHTLTK